MFYTWSGDKKDIFFNGTKCKIRFGNHRFNFQKKWGLIFFSQNWTRRGGRGGGPRASGLWAQKLPILIFEYFPKGVKTNVQLVFNV